MYNMYVLLGSPGSEWSAAFAAALASVSFAERDGVLSAEARFTSSVETLKSLVPENQDSASVVALDPAEVSPMSC